MGESSEDDVHDKIIGNGSNNSNGNIVMQSEQFQTADEGLSSQMRRSYGDRYGSMDYELPQMNREFQNAIPGGGLKNIDEDDEDLTD